MSSDEWLNEIAQSSICWGNDEIHSSYTKILNISRSSGIDFSRQSTCQGFSLGVVIFCSAPQSTTAQIGLWPKCSARLHYIHTIFNRWQLNPPTTFHCNCHSTNLMLQCNQDELWLYKEAEMMPRTDHGYKENAYRVKVSWSNWMLLQWVFSVVLWNVPFLKEQTEDPCIYTVDCGWCHP